MLLIAIFTQTAQLRWRVRMGSVQLAGFVRAAVLHTVGHTFTGLI